MLNKISLIGRLIKDPAGREISKGLPIAQLTVATNHLWRDSRTKEKKEAVEFHNAVCWGRLANVANKYLEKGSQVYLEGRLRYRLWQDKAGQRQYRAEILVYYLEMLGGGKRKSGIAAELDNVTVEEVPMGDDD
jgi:single-strand DNA-binding protein